MRRMKMMTLPRRRPRRRRQQQQQQEQLQQHRVQRRPEKTRLMLAHCAISDCPHEGVIMRRMKMTRTEPTLDQTYSPNAHPIVRAV